MSMLYVQGGRPRRRIISDGGESVVYTASKEIVQNISDDYHIKNDMFPSSNGGKIVSPSCVKVYLNNFAKDEKIVINKRVARKTFLCIASENSLRSTTSYLMNVAASNCIEGKIPQYH